MWGPRFHPDQGPGAWPQWRPKILCATTRTHCRKEIFSKRAKLGLSSSSPGLFGFQCSVGWSLVRGPRTLSLGAKSQIIKQKLFWWLDSKGPPAMQEELSQPLGYNPQFNPQVKISISWNGGCRTQREQWAGGGEEAEHGPGIAWRSRQQAILANGIRSVTRMTPGFCPELQAKWSLWQLRQATEVRWNGTQLASVSVRQLRLGLLKND